MQRGRGKGQKDGQACAGIAVRVELVVIVGEKGECERVIGDIMSTSMMLPFLSNLDQKTQQSWSGPIP